MTPLPPLLTGAVLAFWGWHTGLWWLGLPLALLAELAPRVGWRWELALRERQRVADLCSLLLVLAGIWLYLTQPRLGDALIRLLQWTPALLFPLLAVQLYGGRPGVELSVLMLSLRGAHPGGGQLLDLRPPYLLLCLVAAAMVRPGDYWYYPALSLSAAWGLWPLRPPGRVPVGWGLALALSLALGYGIGLGLQQLQYRVEDLAVDWLADWLGGSPDPYRVTTAIGEVGELKESGRILLRLRPDRPLARPLLLRNTSYDRYVQGIWLARHAPFEPLLQTAAGWQLGAGTSAPLHRLVLTLSLDEGRAILPLPGGSRTLKGLEGARLSRNPYAAVKVEDGPPLARLSVTYGGAFDDPPPEPADLRIPIPEQAAVERIATGLGLPGLPPERALNRLQALFDRDFTYSLQLDAPRQGSALGHFLLEGRSGHCEYFASAAALVLRQAGIPTRYARGWSVQEYSDLEGAWVARERHAHAWVLAWVDGAWRDFDPTPPDWSAWEAERQPWWDGIRDLWQRLAFLLAGGESREGAGHAWLPWLGLLLAALLAWRIARRGRRVRPRAADPGHAAAATATPFTSIELTLARRGHPRHPGETLLEWTRRLEAAGEPAGGRLLPAVDLYYRARFDPHGLEPGERARLGRILAQWDTGGPTPPG